LSLAEDPSNESQMAVLFATKEAILPKTVQETLMQVKGADLLENVSIAGVPVTRFSTAQRKGLQDQEATVEMINVITATLEILVIISLLEIINIQEIDIQMIIQEIKEMIIDTKPMIKIIKETIVEIVKIKKEKVIMEYIEKENIETIKEEVVIIRIKNKVTKI